MKTISGILIVVLLSFVMINGIVQVFNQAGALGNLDSDSLTLVAQYDNDLGELNATFSSNYNNAKNLSQYEPNNNLIGDEIKEYFEHKSRIDQLRDSIDMAYKLPDMFFLAIPFVDIEDTTFYRNVTWFIVWFSLFIAIILALRGGKVTEDQ